MTDRTFKLASFHKEEAHPASGPTPVQHFKPTYERLRISYSIVVVGESSVGR